ncbi:hypothetical protein [Corallococcus llansteffanensis]|uniref:Carrier domain-containing protein n=1 Tax=Corallococcus llansteffanensis TaxID=2316731 RepID=A0A3A8Q6S1_9BACT|nr:hypothetical protein [Corallococcus llansteffanensis]RKH64409.1 hypothetical protein D7V93_07430 [Corallococcus llansteffanensis]
MHDAQELESYIRRKFAEHVGLGEGELFSEDLTLAELISCSQRMTNSVDLMEAFARTSNGLRKDYGLRVRLPALSLDTPVSKVLAVFMNEVLNPERKSA